MLAKLFRDGTETDEVPTMKIAEDDLECPVCCEEFDNSDNMPLVLWCGHTLCKSCVMGLQLAVVKFQIIPVELPCFITCPWCQFLSCRLMWKGKLKYPCKNFFLLWMVENARGRKMERSVLTATTKLGERKPSGITELSQLTNSLPGLQRRGSDHRHVAGEQEEEETNALLLWRQRFRRTRGSKLALIFMLLAMLFCVLPVAASILLIYCLVSLMFALPSFLVVYYCTFPSLSWMVREILA